MKTAVCCIAKKDNHYIKEFVEWYKSLGFSNVLVYDNNEIDDEELSDVIGDYISDGYVIVRNIRGKKEYFLKAYEECYDEFGGCYDWIAFFDVDELLELDCQKYKNINDFFNDDIFCNAQLIRVSWKYFDDNDQIAVINGNYNMRERFTRLADINYFGNYLTKGIIKGGLGHITIDQSGDCGHMVKIDKVVNAVNCLGVPVDNNTTYNGRCWHNAWLCHYCHKTIEEFVSIKTKRIGVVPGWTEEFTDKVYSLDYFFKINKKTQEKIDLYYKLKGL